MLHLKKRKKKNKAVCARGGGLGGGEGRGLAEHAEDPGYILSKAKLPTGQTDRQTPATITSDTSIAATALGLGAQRTNGLVESDP